MILAHLVSTFPVNGVTVHRLETSGGWEGGVVVFMVILHTSLSPHPLPPSKIITEFCSTHPQPFSERV